MNVAVILSKNTLRALQGIPMTIEERPFVAIPVEVLRGLLKGTPIPPSKGLPPGSVEATSYAKASIAKNLKASRLAANLTQAGMAARMGLSQTRISLAERGTVPVSTAFVKRWLSACGFPENWTARA
jgi:hypothetical protein